MRTIIAVLAFTGMALVGAAAQGPGLRGVLAVAGPERAVTVQQAEVQIAERD